MKLRLSAAARADLREIGLYIARDSPARAESFVLELRDACELLAARPQLFPVLPRHRDSGLRRRRHGSYLIFYRVLDEAVEVARILHGARDYEKILFPESD